METLNNNDYFICPYIELDFTREYTQIKGLEFLSLKQNE